MTLHIFNNPDVMIAAQTLLIVIGSMLLGMLVTYRLYSRIRKELDSAQEEYAKAIRKQDELKGQVHELLEKQSSFTDERVQMNDTIYRLQNQLAAQQIEINARDSTNEQTEQLQKLISEYRQRLHIIETELLKAKSTGQVAVLRAEQTAPVIRMNYDHVASLLGRSVTENDLTLISGIGPKTASLLQKSRIDSWEALASTTPESLKQVLDDGGMAFRSLDPSHWPDQASMAAKGEWRKLKAFQSYLRSRAESEEA